MIGAQVKAIQFVADGLVGAGTRQPDDPASSGPGARGSSAGAVPGSRVNLRTKALVIFVLVATYVGVVGLYLQNERTEVLQFVRALEDAHRREELMGRIGAAGAHATLIVNEAHFATDRQPDWTAVALGTEALLAGLLAASDRHEAFGTHAERLQAHVARVMRERSRDSLIELRLSVQDSVHAIDVTAATLREQRQRLSQAYRQGFERLTLEAIAFALFGLTVFGVVLAVFFARMAWDIRRLERRAIRIVGGYRGPPIDVTRGDEIGMLMRSVNQMQAELRAREARIEIGRQERMHQEKMAAIGSLAAGIAHEINNPIAAIAGVAEEIHQTLRERHCPHSGASCRPDLILHHARRVATITQQISKFSSPGSPEREYIDLNSLIESLCGFVRYDRRFRTIALGSELDRSLPAVEAVADHLTQVLMNLLMNAADACEGRAGACVSLRTQNAGAEVVVSIVDNGTGMTQPVLARAFDEYFTTKPPDRGTGLGLPICRRLLEGLGGALALESVPEQGTTAVVRIPVPQALRG